MKRITSRDNAAIKHLHALATSARDRRKAGETLLDGPHLVQMAQSRGQALRQIVVSDTGLAQAEIVVLLAAAPDVDTLVLPDTLFAHVSPVDSPSGVLAVMPLPGGPAGGRPTGDCVLLDGVQDPGNLGTILRTAAAAGVADVLLTPGCAQAWSPRVLRAAMGAHFLLRVVEGVEAADALADYPGAILATALQQATDLFATDLRGPVAWLFGSEGQGLSEGVAALASGRVRIAMPGGMESLNVGVAAGVCLFEQVRQRSLDRSGG